VILKGERIGFYGRYSSDKQNERSVEDQLQLGRDILRPLGTDFSPNLVFTDFAISAASAERPDFDRLMRAVRNRELDVLIVEKTCRMSRNNSDAWHAWDELA
jgi:DNA invertase Pin-like site-specific DNA recombinase